MLICSKNRLLLIASLFTASLHADVELDKLFNMSIEELLQVEIEGSTRTHQSLLTVPSSVTVFTHEEITRMGATTLNELMNYAPGFQSRRSGESSVISASTTRGHTSGTASRDILVLIDGQRINSDFNAGAGINLSLLPLENVKKVEFLRGAGSSLYGSNAFSAVINITTLNDVNELTAQFSSHSSKATALVSMKDEDTLFSGFIKGIHDNGEDYYSDNTFGSGKISTEDPYDSVDLYLQAKYKDLSLYISYNRRSIEDFYIFKRPSHRNDNDTEFSSIRATYDMDFSENFHSQIALSYTYNSTEPFAKVSPQGPAFPNDALYGNGTIKEEAPSIEWFNSYTLNSEHSFQFGAEYRRPKITDATIEYNYDIISSGFPFPYTPYYPSFPLSKEDERDIYGIYTQYQGSFLDNLHLTLGLRYDDYSDFGDSWNPRAALVYQAFEETSFKLLYSKAFRAPSRNELDLINNGALVGNKDLDAETIETYEAIIIQQFQEHSISLSYYINQIDDIIVDVTRANGSIVRENVEDGEYTGLEVEYIGSFMKDLQVRASYSHVFTKPDFAFRSSDNIFSAILNYNRDKYNINLSGFYHSSAENSYAGIRRTIPSYSVYNTKLTYHVTKSASLFFQVKNIFDKYYYAPSEGDSLSFSVPNRGRENFGGFEFTF